MVVTSASGTAVDDPAEPVLAPVVDDTGGVAAPAYDDVAPDNAAVEEPTPVETTVAVPVSDEAAVAAHVDYVRAAEALGTVSCSARLITDSIPFATETVTWWRAECGPVSCHGRIVSGPVGEVVVDTGRCELDDATADFAGPYRSSDELATA